jgi:hypothetical protein
MAKSHPRENRSLAAEAAALASDEEDRREAVTVSTLMDILRSPVLDGNGEPDPVD